MNNILSGYEKPYEAFGVRKNEGEYPLRLEARNIPYKGKMVRVVEFSDITEQKQAALRQTSQAKRINLAFWYHCLFISLVSPGESCLS